jgi:putative transcriptional regulator
MARMKTTRKRAKSAKIDWRRFDAMSDAQHHQAALNDPDARPLSDEDLARMKRRVLQLLPQRIDNP